MNTTESVWFVLEIHAFPTATVYHKRGKNQVQLGQVCPCFSTVTKGPTPILKGSW